jgi:CAAX protease family protein
MVVDREVTPTMHPPITDSLPGDPGSRLPAWGAKRALKALAGFLGAQLAVAGGVGVWAGLRGSRGAFAAGGGITLDPSLAIAAAFGGTLLAGLAVLFMVRRTSDGWEAVGWRVARARAVAVASLQGFALVCLLVLLGRVLPAPHQAAGPLARLARLGGWARFGWAVLAFVVAPPVEELMFRGALYSGLVRATRPFVAGAITTVIFVGLHVPEIGAYWPAWLAIGLLGALALRARVVTGSLVPAIALHATYNLGLVLAVYAGGR